MYIFKESMYFSMQDYFESWGTQKDLLLNQVVMVKVKMRIVGMV